MAKRKQTIEWLKENTEYHGYKKTDICFISAIVLSVLL
jgi:hypothetical protein